MNNTNEKLLTINNVAQRLGVHSRTVRRYIHMGYIEAIDISSGKRPSYRVKESKLNKYINDCQVL